ncbi:MAG: conjugal transfer protein [Methylococcaceae bacterium]|nr:conjugal transfer protein [Methylococcaceae bacterium]
MFRLPISLLSLVLIPTAALAFGTPPDSLKGVKVPATPGLLDGKPPIVVNKLAATQLGKALFWDVNVGSDGVACASCHFHAGIDRRTRNQLNPGQTNTGTATTTSFEITASGALGGPNYDLKASDFPLHQFATPSNRDSAVNFKTDDIVGSAGTFLQVFQDINYSGDGNDNCAPTNDEIFHLESLNTRRVTTRNAPSVINVAFNFRNFWDGRANNLFNGESAFGPRDAKAGVWLAQNGKPVKKRLLLENASLASQAVAPPLNDVEMSCEHRTFSDLAKKLLHRRPLESQQIHPEDSTLGSIRHSSGKGLEAYYEDLIKQAFAKRFWMGKGDFGTPAGGATYPQMEANFAFFFGLAIQLYEQTLISDQSLFDGKRDRDNVPIAFNEQQKRGLNLFTKAECIACHAGPAFTTAAIPKIKLANGLSYNPVIKRSTLFEEFDGFGVAHTLIDTGFMITSVSDPESDPGLGGKDPYGHPLSFAEQYVASLANPANSMLDPVKVVTCTLDAPFAVDFISNELRTDPNSKYCNGYKGYSKIPTPETVKSELAKPGQGLLMSSIKGAFKIPTLRNIELTGPYMHNGSMKSLEEVIEFYNRGGNNFHNPQHTETLVFPHGFSSQDKSDLVAFLKTLTDERVRWERAPFDHPELQVLNGHEDGISAISSGYAADRIMHIDPVGKNGRTQIQGPLLPFENYLLQ